MLLCIQETCMPRCLVTPKANRYCSVTNRRNPASSGVLRIADALDQVVEATMGRVSSCDCGEETSCYGCLRSFGNQRFHEDLSHGRALHALHPLRAGGGLTMALAAS
jgi:hypothetical protein